MPGRLFLKAWAPMGGITSASYLPHCSLGTSYKAICSYNSFRGQRRVRFKFPQIYNEVFVVVKTGYGI